jgi:hypothetical protein
MLLIAMPPPLRVDGDETANAIKALRRELRERALTGASIDAAGGWRSGYTTDVLAGRKYLHFEVLIRILRAAGISPGQFFRDLYPDADADKRPEAPAASWPAPITPPATHMEDALRWLEARVGALEQRAGVVPGLPSEAPPDSYLEDLVRRTVRQIEAEDDEDRAGARERSRSG